MSTLAIVRTCGTQRTATLQDRNGNRSQPRAEITSARWLTRVVNEATLFPPRFALNTHRNQSRLVSELDPRRSMNYQLRGVVPIGVQSKACRALAGLPTLVTVDQASVGNARTWPRAPSPPASVVASLSAVANIRSTASAKLSALTVG